MKLSFARVTMSGSGCSGTAMDKLKSPVVWLLLALMICGVWLGEWLKHAA